MVNVLQVEYCVETFCDKNRDELPKESDELFASSSNPFVVHLFVPPGSEYCIEWCYRGVSLRGPAIPHARRLSAWIVGVSLALFGGLYLRRCWLRCCLGCFPS